MSEEVNKIIDNLCEKLGTSAKLLIPELAKMHIAEAVVTIVISMAVLAICAYVVWRTWQKCEDLECAMILVILPFIVAMIAIGTFAITAVDLAGWIASPTAKATQEIIGMLR